MRVDKRRTPRSSRLHRRDETRRRQRIAGALALLVLLVAACGGGQTARQELVAVEQFPGGAVADEPRAVLVAQDILAEGGNAADAAVGLYFALAVTYPGAAGLGGGGACVVFDRGKKLTESLVFFPRAPASGGDIAVPANARGMAALHARYGRLHWGKVLAPAEKLARFGVPLSRAYVKSLEAVGSGVLSDRRLWRLAVGADGRLRREGETVRQPELADTLAALRLRSGGTLATGALAQSLVAGMRTAGVSLTPDDMRRTAPTWRQTLRFDAWDLTLHTVPKPASGELVIDLWRRLANGDRYRKAPPSERPAMFAEAASRVYGVAGVPTKGPVGDDSSTGFVVVDRTGSAVACTVTMNRPFGARRMAGGTGILLAAALPSGTGERAFLTPLLVVNRPVVALRKEPNQLFLAATATGGAPAPASLAGVVYSLLTEDRPLGEALAAPRVFAGPPSAPILYEATLGRESAAVLERRGGRPAGPRGLGRINAVYCADGLPNDPQSCRFGSDPRGYGMSVGND